MVDYLERFCGKACGAGEMSLIFAGQSQVWVGSIVAVMEISGAG
jgi:hypothetical protein